MNEIKITPLDIGRVCISYNGQEWKIGKNHGNKEYPYIAILRNGERLEIDDKGYDIYGKVVEQWADEPAADQVADQVRPKDLRDEFAMVAFGAIITTMPHTPKQDGIIQKGETLADVIARSAYVYADAMLKARGK